MMDDKSRKLEEAIREAAPDNRLSCTAARAVASELGVAVADVGDAADRLGVKIHGCELGCF